MNEQNVEVNEQNVAKESREVASRRTVIKGAAWSVPVIATAVATPLAAATTTCEEPAIVRGVGGWWFEGPEDTGPGYVRADTNASGPGYVYAPSSVLPFTWSWTAVADDTGIIPAGAQIRLGQGGNETLARFGIVDFPVPSVDHPSVVFSHTNPGTYTYHIFVAATDIPAGTAITFTGSVTLGDAPGEGPGSAGYFGAWGNVVVFEDAVSCPPVAARMTNRSQWFNPESVDHTHVYRLQRSDIFEDWPSP